MLPCDEFSNCPAAPLQSLGFEAGWQQLSRLHSPPLEPTLDTLQEPEVIEQMGWQAVVLSAAGSRRGPALGADVEAGLLQFQEGLESLLLQAMPSSAPLTLVLENYSEVVVPQFQAHTGRWQRAS